MKLIDYIKRLTEDGTSVILPNEKHQQEKMTTRDDLGGGFEVVRYTSESLSQGKAEERQLKTITSAVLNTPSCDAWWNYCVKICPSDYENDGVTSEVQDLYNTLLTTLSIRLSEMLIVERHFNSAKTLLSILNTRMKAWSKEVKVEADGKADTAITFSITGL